MIKIIELVDDKIKELKKEEYLIDKHLSWVDCYNATPEELAVISEKTGIPTEELNVSLDPDARPRVLTQDRYSLLLFAAPYYEKEVIKTTTVAMFLFKKDVITFRNHELDAIKEIQQLPPTVLKNLFRKDSSFFVYHFLDDILEDYFKIMDNIETDVDSIEDEVIERPDKKTVQRIFRLKKTLIFFHKALAANREVITAIEKEYITEFTRADDKRFRDLYNDIVQLIDLEGTYRDILTGSLDMYLSAISNNLNNVMKILTVITAFVMIPTLIAGIYGMNFQVSQTNMPELHWKFGYFWALGLMAVAVFATYLYFKKKGWMD